MNTTHKMYSDVEVSTEVMTRFPPSAGAIVDGEMSAAYGDGEVLHHQ